ncbi:hypothetical protein Csa_005576 [Cucumis sativus]|uniref:Uncharacterized protein n=1 Tax=Cucumis sativus TaxID=3659 RepID=A0A0A0KCM3_CUCSA|nr:hypothetical protein Csa_005576 [Cucumis sativus]
MSDDEEMFEIEINMKRYRELRESKCKEVENQGPIRTGEPKGSIVVLGPFFEVVALCFTVALCFKAVALHLIVSR